jgi:signal transduction histidine kinase
MGAEVVPMTDGVEAFEYCKEHLNELDLILTDLHMEQMNGNELCVKVRNELGGKLPIIFLTAEPRKEVVLDLMKSGGTDYLSKPYLKEELLSRIGIHLEARNYQIMLEENLKKSKDLVVMKDKLLKVCAHDLRTPLNGILGFSDLMIDEPKAMDEEQVEYVGLINSSGNQLLQYINELLDLTSTSSNVENLILESVNLNNIVINTVKNFAQVAKLKQIKIKYLLPDEIISVRANEVALTRVLSNLVSNAIKFTPEMGNVDIEVILENETVILKVQDSGMGMPANVLPEIFTNGASIGRTGTAGEKSTGLGLGIVKELMSKQNAEISVSSIETEGTCFTLKLSLFS